MRLSDLIPHTSAWTGIPETHVNTVARALRPTGLLSTAGKGPRAAEMTTDDKINLLLGVCGVEVANRAAEHVRVWRQLIRITSHTDDPFAFTKSTTVKDFFVDLITKDLNGGALDAWLKEEGTQKGEVVLDFYVDQGVLTLVVSRLVHFADPERPDFKKTATESLETRFIPPPPYGETDFILGFRQRGYKAGSQLIRRLDAKNLRGWGTCLTDDVA